MAAFESFTARWNSGAWSNLIDWLDTSFDLAIGIAYMVIPAIFMYFVIKKRAILPYWSIFILFTLFVLLCGILHFMETSISWHPWYPFSALIEFSAGLVSVLIVIALFRILPSALQLKTSNDIEVQTKAFKRRKEKFSKEVHRLNEANKDLQSFAFVASHDLQEPLRMINQNLKRLDRYLGDSLDPKPKKYMAFAKEGSERMVCMIEDLLEYSRHEADESANEDVDLNTILRDVEKDLGSKIQQSNTEICSDELPVLNGHRSQFLRLFYNLISNSIKYKDLTRPPVIKITYHKTDSSHVLTFEDNGRGFNPKDSKKIFEMFKRSGENSTIKGSGIGLSTVKKIVLNHAGNISAESTQGKGSSFIISFAL